jgi:pimeloyl-ACP methyl ester carboxylesterase
VEGAARIAIAPDGVHVQYRLYGAGEPALVFIHGWSCDSNYWREQLPAFKQKYTLVTVDLAGHGGTDGNRTEWSIARFGQDVATALSAVPNKQIILVGHSMGGPVAIEAARLLEGRVIGIIGIDTFKSIGAPRPSKAQVDAAIKPFEADFIGQTRTLVADHLFVKGANPQLAQRIAYDMSLSSPRVAVPSMRAVLEYDFTEPLKDISVPIVAINSDLGEPVNEARIRKVLPKFRTVTLPGTGHFLMMEDPQRFNPALEAEVATMIGSAGS